MSSFYNYLLINNSDLENENIFGGIIFLLKESEDFNLLFLYMKCLIKFKF